MHKLVTEARQAAGRPRASAARTTYVSVLDVDPDLGASVPLDQLQHAKRAAQAPGFDHPPGRWAFRPAPDRASLGTLIVHGLITVRIEAADRAHLELLGAGDVISPWIGFGPELSFPTLVSARVVSDARLALLDRHFALRTARWPEIHAALSQRQTARSRRLGLQAAINSIPRVEDRVELALWALASRFGSVTSAGLRLRLRLTHSQLADIVGAQRPSVTMAIAQLEHNQRLRRCSRDEWLLLGPEPSLFSPLIQQSGLSV